MTRYRDYTFFDKCAQRLSQDVYPQPPDPGHTAWALHSLDWIETTVFADKMEKVVDEETGEEHLVVKEKIEPSGKVLDVGCGWGFLSRPFEAMGMDWTGVTIGADVAGARSKLQEYGLSPEKVIECEMTFLPWEKPEFDLVYARHVLEHSPYPIITLMEWRRVTKPGGYICLIAPAPQYWLYRGRNHYSIVPKPLLKWWLERAGWHLVHEFAFTSRDPLFLKHLEVYQTAIKDAKGGPDYKKAMGEDVLMSYPEGPVEFRFICRKAKEVLE
jgi:ubiquinone/menaquinone biosynthesis C-methylase UbiE